MKKKDETRYFVTDVASVPVYKVASKTEMYRMATKPGWGAVEWYSAADGYEKTEDGYRHNEQFPIGHGEKSVILILRHMPLTDEEITAISWHMGAFDSRAGASRSLSQAWEKCPLALRLHLADMEATWFDEGRGRKP